MKMKILACNNSLFLAKAVAKICNIAIVDSTIARFSDSEISVEINETVRGEEIFVMQSLSNPVNENLMELLLCLDALRRASASTITVVAPYFGYARQDRKPFARTAISAKLLANLIITSGADRVLTMDIHAEQIQGFYDIPFDNLYSSVIFADEIKKRYNRDNLVIVSPDIGGVARARKLSQRLGCSLVIIDKRRNNLTKKAEVIEVIGNVENKNCIIVDDIIDSGNTLCNATLALLEKGATEVNAFITHAVLSERALANINASNLKNLFVTNTIDCKNKAAGIEKIIIIDISSLLAEAMKRISIGGSISKLFN